MDNALALHHNLDLLRRKIKQPHCLDQLQALVHQSGAVDGDLGAHIPVGVLQRIRTGLAAQLFGGHAKERPARGREQDLGQRFGAVGILQALENGGMLAVDRQQLYAMGSHGIRNQLAARDKAFFVGQRQIMPAFNGS